MPATIDTNAPKYRILDVKGFFADDDTLYAEGSVLYWYGVPNDQMEPLNDSARQRMQEYLTELDNGARATAAKFGRDFTGRMTDFAEIIATAMTDAKKEAGAKVEEPKKIEMPRSNRDVPLMGSVAISGQKRRGRPPKVQRAAPEPVVPPDAETKVLGLG